jgi:hypothetical protein
MELAINPKLTAKTVYELLLQHQGKESALKSYEIVELITNQRSNPQAEWQVRMVVKDLCNRGFPICSDSQHGYWYAMDQHELGETIEVLYRRAMCTLKRIRNMRKYGMPIMTGQITLPVGSEPTLPPDEQLAKILPPQNVSAIADIPEALYEALNQFIEERGDWDRDRLFTAALCMFLIQQGKQNNQTVKTIYMEAYKNGRK